MNSQETKPTLPTWIFVVTDLALLGAAAVIAYRSSQPLSGGAMLAIVGCVGLGAMAGLVPLIVRFERQKNAMLDDRQRALEALARTLTSSAEQISIATGSLHEIGEIAQKNLRQAEHLPHKLQEKIAEFQAQLAVANDAEKEELERELVALRTTESERLEAISTKIAKSTSEWAKLEAGAARHLTAANELLAKLPAGTSDAIGRAQAAAEQALAESRLASVRVLDEAGGDGARAIAAAQTAGLAALSAKLTEIDSHLAASTAKAVDRISQELSARISAATDELGRKIAQIESAARKMEPAATQPAALAVSDISPVNEVPPPAGPAAAAAPAPILAGDTSAAVEPPAESPPAAPVRPRRARRTSAPDAESAPASDSMIGTGGAVSAASLASENVALKEPHSPLPFDGEPAPVPVEKIVEVAPVAPHTAEPFAEPPAIAPAPPAVEAAPPVEIIAPQPVAAVAAPPLHRRATRRPEPEPSPTLDLPLEEPAAGAAPGTVERTLTSDGATRLLATAYIGIGNRLFIRGDGPGLSWEKGVPLQFVSIGKWRWETNDASTPVRFKLYKNDEQECTTLGQQSLEPGHLQELTAAF